MNWPVSSIAMKKIQYILCFTVPFAPVELFYCSAFLPTCPTRCLAPFDSATTTAATFPHGPKSQYPLHLSSPLVRSDRQSLMESKAKACPTQRLFMSRNIRHAVHTELNEESQRSLEFKTQMQKAIMTLSLAATIFLSTGLPSVASDYGSLTEEQRAVAEAWRIVDNNFIDRTFNHQDWFKIRQDAIKKKYKNMAEAQNEIDRMVSSLGDKYTRYLPPAKYRSIVDSATGTLAGVGVEISLDKDTGRIYVSDTEPSSPASLGKCMPDGGC